MPDALEVRNLSFSYDDGREALREVSFCVGENECVGLIGPNGAGKSTLLLHLNGILPERLSADPTVFVGGVPLTRANLGEIRRRVGLLFQEADDQLFCPTVWEDAAFGPRQLGLAGAALGERVRESLARVNLEGFEHRRPHQLSQGEKRRVCLAGVLACEPSVLVLDEPTSALDPRGRRELKALLARLPGAKIIATHDLELVVELCPRALLLDGGRIIADGPSVALLSDEKLMLAHGLEKPHILLHRHPHGGEIREF
jgi:cobalt/nickel transport system ATP-binding protein